VDRPTEAATGPADTAGSRAAARVTAEPVQRWRLTFARDPVPPDLVGRTAMDAWQERLAASGLPLAGLESGGAGRARFALAAPLPAAASGLGELADIWLLERRPIWAVREALEGRMPPAHRYVAAENVWLGAPPLPGQVIAAAWSVRLAEPAPSRDRLAAAGRELLAASTLTRVRVRGGGDRPYDLRPLVDDVGPVGATGRARGRSGSSLGSTPRSDPAAQRRSSRRSAGSSASSSRSRLSSART